jgi:hypothetical protein
MFPTNGQIKLKRLFSNLDLNNRLTQQSDDEVDDAPDDGAIARVPQCIHDDDLRIFQMKNYSSTKSPNQ